MALIKVILFMCLWVASRADTDLFKCRFQVSNVSADLADQVRRSDFLPGFEISGSSNASITRIGNDVGEDPAMAEVVVKVQNSSGDRFIAVRYKDIGIPIDHVTLRCSKINASDSHQIIESYVLKLGLPTQVAGSQNIGLSVTLDRQNQVDCFLSGGYEDPYSLERSGRYLADGERFEIGCSMVGNCRNGGISGVSRCPPQIFPPTMDEVRNVGQCCDDGLDKATVEAKGCPKNEDGIAFTFPTTSNSRYRPVLIPWQVRFGKKNGDLTCDGVIINELWFLTTKSCLNDRTNLEFHRPHSIKHKNISIMEVKKVIDDDPSLDLVLAKLSNPFVSGDWTTAIQKVNLPWSKTICEKFLESNCHILLGTEERNVNADSNVLIAVTNGTSQGNLKSVQKQGSWPVLLGSGAVSWSEKANYLVGIYVGNSETKVTGDKITLKGPWKDDGVAGKLISVCSILDDVRQKVGN